MPTPCHALSVVRWSRYLCNLGQNTHLFLFLNRAFGHSLGYVLGFVVYGILFAVSLIVLATHMAVVRDLTIKA